MPSYLCGIFHRAKELLTWKQVSPNEMSRSWHYSSRWFGCPTFKQLFGRNPAFMQKVKTENQPFIAEHSGLDYLLSEFGTVAVNLVTVATAVVAVLSATHATTTPLKYDGD
jgi:hypothetical protein